MESMESSVESPVSMEFAVKMSCKDCEDSVQRALADVQGVKSVTVNLKNESVLVETTLTSNAVQALIEKSGKEAVLRGVAAPSSQLGAAVVEFYGMGGVKGVTHFVQLSEKNCLIDGTLDGLTPGSHGFAVCESGDLSDGCQSVGNHYNPTHDDHNAPDAPSGHLGDLGNIHADANGRATFRIQSSRLQLSDLIGRALVVHAFQDDCGRQPTDRSKIDGSAGPKIACGIIARSAGIMQNDKKICSCSGETLWDERESAKIKSSGGG